MLDTREVAAYLRLKERRIYDLVRANAIPHVRATGKLLFPRQEIDAWLASKAQGHAVAPRAPAPARPPIIAGSHDPLLEWAARESGCGLAILACGSREGVERLAADRAIAAAAHWRDAETGEFNVRLVRERLGDADVVALEWARRTQGLVLATDNPRRVQALADVVRRGLRVVPRQAASGSHQLFAQLLAQAGIDDARIQWLPRAVHAETELAAAVLDGRADAGFGIEAAARAHGLGFLPLTTERLDLVCHRRDAFELALQTLFAFARGSAFAAKARALGGYDVSAFGRVTFNA
jgi:excisionase family DNA binding protein